MASLTSFPTISSQEFAEACKALDSRSADKISGTTWLSVRWTGEELLIKQRRDRPEDGGCGQETKNEDLDGGDIEEDDIPGHITVDKIDRQGSLIVEFSITLSPTYAVPILWFSCRSKIDEKFLSLEQVYAVLVPTGFAALRNIGVMGGISMTHHPVTDFPAFFLHPCNTQEALLRLKPFDPLSPEDYLILWIGLMGSAVNLYVPSQLMST